MHTQSHTLYFYRFVYSFRVTEYFSAITPTQHDHCLFSAAGLCPQRLYIVSSELLLCSAAPAFGNLITWLHQLLLSNTQWNKMWLVHRSVVWPQSITLEQIPVYDLLQTVQKRRGASLPAPLGWICKQFGVVPQSLHILSACSVSPGVHKSVW